MSHHTLGNAVALRQLKQGYRGRLVLDGVSLDIPAGQTFALLGRNGAGKTTLIRTLLGLLAPLSGSVEVLGLAPAKQPSEVRRRVGYLAEDQAMYGWMTADEIARFLAPFYPGWDAALARQLFERFEVPRATRIKHLSKGQNIRLGLALALAHRPELVILDDPALGLDPITRKQFNRDIIDHLQAQGSTVLYSSHLLYEVEAVADAVAILDQGRFVRVGATEEVQRTVQRVFVSEEALASLPRPGQLLDIRRERGYVAITLDDAPAWLATLQAEGVPHRIEELCLDEIFEAYVIGQTADWPNAAGRGAMAERCSC
jgi:ABC-2 type transport system ATP-binding protein